MHEIGVLVAGFGGADSLTAVPQFMHNLTGRMPSEELVQRVSARYEAIGGTSPIVKIARLFAKGLSDVIERGLKERIPVGVGMCYWDPFIEDSLAGLTSLGCKRVVVVHLSAFQTKVAAGASQQAITSAAKKLGLQVVETPLLASYPAYQRFFAAATTEALGAACATAAVGDGGRARAQGDRCQAQGGEGQRGPVLAFTAHSLPLCDLDDGDPYLAGLEQMAQAVAVSLGFGPGEQQVSGGLLGGFKAFGSGDQDPPWFLVFQSKGERPGKWLGPTLEELIDACAKSGVPSVVACPIGFVTDHMETLYDLDVDACGQAQRVGIRFSRTPVPNALPALVEEVGAGILALISK